MGTIPSGAAAGAIGSLHCQVSWSGCCLEQLSSILLDASPPPPSWACCSSARPQEERPVRRKADAHWPSPFPLSPSKPTHTLKVDAVKSKGMERPLGWAGLAAEAAALILPRGRDQCLRGSYVKLSSEHTPPGVPGALQTQMRGATPHLPQTWCMSYGVSCLWSDVPILSP